MGFPERAKARPHSLAKRRSRGQSRITRTLARSLTLTLTLTLALALTLTLALALTLTLTLALALPLALTLTLTLALTLLEGLTLRKRGQSPLSLLARLVFALFDVERGLEALLSDDL